MSDLGHRVAVLSCVPLRAEPNDRAEQVSQILAGEIVEVVSECEGNWFELSSLEDGYKGFADPRHFTVIKDFKKVERTVIKSPLSNWCFAKSKLPIVLPAGSYLISDFKGEYLGDDSVWATDEPPFGEVPNSIHEAAMQFLGAPYQWGGRTMLGIDCSGLTQIAARIVGKRLFRDASDQALEGDSVEWEDRCVNDLAYFENKEGRITHVGILTSQEEIIHASGDVRIDGLTEKGIIHSESGELTHNLSHLRRLS